MNWGATEVIFRFVDPFLMPICPLTFGASGGARYIHSRTVRKPRPNRNHISKRVRRKHRRAA